MECGLGAYTKRRNRAAKAFTVVARVDVHGRRTRSPSPPRRIFPVVSLKAVLRELSPPILWRAIAAMRPRQDPPPPPPAYGHFGTYASFDDALKECTGYETQSIIDATLGRTLAMRPSTKITALDIRQLAALQHAQRYLGRLRVLDFGGAMGGLYFRIGSLLDIEKWTVVDVPGTVNAAARLARDALSFSSSLVEQHPNIVLASGSLQYTRSPYEEIAKLKALGARYFVADRIPILQRARLTVQRVPPEIFEASFPAWFFGPEFTDAFSDMKLALEWELPEHPAFLDGAAVHCYRGFLFEAQP